MALNFPSSPSLNQTYTYGGKTWVWNGSAWVGQNIGLTVSASAPASPVDGSLWWDTENGVLRIRFNDGDSSQWVEVSAQGPQGSTGPAGADGAGETLPPFLAVDVPWHSGYAGNPWYPLNAYPLNIVGQTFSASQIHAFPFVLSQNMTLEGLAARVNTGVASSKIRFGIYSANTSDYYPNALLLDSGEFATTTSSQHLNVTGQSLALTKHTWYWAAWQTDTAASNMFTTDQYTNPLLGYQTNLFQQTAGFITVARAYSALPATFPASAVVNGLRPLALWARASA